MYNHICCSPFLAARRRSGEIGIHARLKILWGQPRVGSSPTCGTTSELISTPYNFVQTSGTNLYGVLYCSSFQFGESSRQIG